MAKALYKFHWDVGRMGEVSGSFIADEAAVEAALGSYVDLGEALGKHSEVYGTLDAEDLTVVTRDSDVIEKLGDFSVGYNPLDYIEHEED